jgi:hypothetical protein
MRGIEKRRGNNELALGARRFIFRCNNPQIVGGSNGGDDGEDVQPGQSIWGGVLSLCLGQQIEQQKIIKITYDVALDGCCWIFTNKNQPKTRGHDGAGK